MNEMEWRSYIRNYARGIKTWIFKEDANDVEEARKRMLRWVCYAFISLSQFPQRRFYKFVVNRRLTTNLFFVILQNVLDSKGSFDGHHFHSVVIRSQAVNVFVRVARVTI